MSVNLNPNNLAFDSTAVEQVYVGSNSGTSLSTNDTTNLNTLRTNTATASDLATLDSQIQQFENAIVPTTDPSGRTDEDYPYDQQGILNHFLDQVVGEMLNYDASSNNNPPVFIAKTSQTSDPATETTSGNINTATSTYTGANLAYSIDEINSNDPSWNTQGSTSVSVNTGGTVAVPNVLLNMLTPTGQDILKQYAQYIQSVFNEGNQLKNDPTDPATVSTTNPTGLTVNTADVVSIPPVVIGGQTYDKTATIEGAVVYIQQGSQLSTTQKYQLMNTQNQPYDVRVGFQPPTTTSDNIVIGYYTPTSENLSTTTSGVSLTNVYALPGLSTGLHFGSDGNFYTATPPTTTTTQNYTLSSPITPTTLSSPFLANGVLVNRSISVTGTNGTTTYYVSQDSTKLIPAPLVSQTYQSTAATGFAGSFNIGGQTLDLTNPDANGNQTLGTNPVTAITPTTVSGQTVNATVTINSQNYYLTPDDRTLILDPSTLGTPATTTISNLHNLDIMEFIYYWNEAKMHVLKAQLAYQQDITQLMNTSLTQANSAMADLEKQSGTTEATDSKGNANQDAAAQTLALHLFSAENATTTDRIIPTGLASNNDSVPGGTSAGQWQAFFMDNSQFQQARTALQNFIDRKTADEQSATTTYQNSVNTMNNDYNTMSQLQQTLENLLTQQLHNWTN